MDLNGIFAFVQKSPSLRAAINIVLAAGIEGVAFAVTCGYVHPWVLDPGRSIWTLPASAFVSLAVVLVVGFVVAFALAAIMMYAVESLIVGIRAAATRRTTERGAERERDRLARARLDTETRDKERLARLLPSYPDEHRAILTQFADGDASPVNLRRADGLGADPITQALVTGGYLVCLAPVDYTHALYALRPNAAEPVRTYFDSLRQAEAAKRRERAETAVRDADVSARQLLSLFGDPNPKSATSAPHPWLTNDVYGSIRGLVQEGVLTQVADGHQLPRRKASVPRAEPLTEPIVLTDNGKDAVERHVLHGPVARTRIDLRLDHVASSVERGAGLRSSY